MLIYFNQGDHDVFNVPILPISRSDFLLRCDTKLLLSKIGIDESHLVFNDEFDILSKEIRSHLKIVLVDHNQISLKLADLTEVSWTQVC